MATPSTVSSVQTDALISTFDINKPEKRNILFRKYGKQGLGFFNVLDTLGYKTPVAQTTYQHFEEDWIHQAVHVNANVASPGAGNPISFVLKPTLDLDSANRYFVQVNDNVMFANQVTGLVTGIVAVGATVTVTVQPNQAIDNIGALNANDTVIIYSDSWAEGTSQPPGHISKPIEYEFSTKIIKVTNEVTGSSQTDRAWVDITSDGQSLAGGWWLKGWQIDTDYEMTARMDGALLFDRPNTNTTLTNLGNRNTTGLVPWVRSGGNVDTYNQGFYSIVDFDSQNEILDQNFAPSEMLSLLGIQLHLEWGNLFQNSFTAGAIVYANFSDGKKAADLNMDFNSFSKGERVWHLKRMGIFNHPQFYGAPGYKMPGMGILTPMDSVKNADPQNDSNNIPSIGMRYKALDGYSRQMEVWTTGGGGKIPVKTSQTDISQLNMRTEMGSEYIASNRFYLIEQL